MEEDLKKILESAIQAPSGENSQPWRVKVSGMTVELWNNPESDQSLYNSGQLGSMIAHGAFIENAVIAAKHYGYETGVALFPNKENLNQVAVLSFSKKATQTEDILFSLIEKRCTNRKSYKTDAVEAAVANDLISGSSGNVKIYVTQETEAKEILGAVGGANEQIMLSNEYIHGFFFSHVSWTKEEDRERSVGFFIDTLELPAPARFAFKFIQKWNRLAFLNKYLGLYKAIGKQNAKVYGEASGFLAFTVPANSPESFVEAGRIIERTWLVATKHGLSMQPVSGLLFLRNAMLRNDTATFFNDEQRITITEAYQNIQKVFSLPENETVAFMFRFGRSNPPTARASRFPLEKIMYNAS